MKPFLKWAGGKYSQLNQILPFIPKGKRLIEPFVGAGSVFMNAGFQDVIINDVNPDLINLYKILKHNGPKLIYEAGLLNQWCNSEERYNRIRERMNTREYSAYSQAAFFLVLNRCGYNGMCRYNLDFEFNIPWGKDEVTYFPTEELNEFINAGFHITALNDDFQRVMGFCQPGDVIFCDPPYHPMPGKNGFTTYSGKTFGLGDQKRLVDAALAAQAKGVPTVITNSGAPVIFDMYSKAGFTIYPLSARRSVSCTAESRGEVQDIIAVLK